MTDVMIFGAFLVILGVVWLFVDRGLSRRAANNCPSAPPPQHKYQTYGHPRPPVPSLFSKLPEAPDSHRWEIKVTTSDNGDQWLHLTLVHIPTAADVATKKVSLTYEYGSTTYAKQYREYHSIKGDTFWNSLIGPLVDWAQQQINKFDSGTTEYRMG